MTPTPPFWNFSKNSSVLVGPSFPYCSFSCSCSTSTAHAFCYFTVTPSIHQDVFSSSAELASLARLDTFPFGLSWKNLQSFRRCISRVHFEKYNSDNTVWKIHFILACLEKLCFFSIPFSFIEVKRWKWVETNCRPFAIKRGTHLREAPFYEKCCSNGNPP